MPRTSSLKGLLATCAALLAAPCWSMATSPDQLVEDTAGKILSQIDANHSAYEAEPQLLSQVVRTDLLPLLDMEYSARLILGRAGRGASSEQIHAFTEVMTARLVDRYSAGLMRFRSREQLEVLPLRGDLNERATRVRTRVRLDTGGFAPVDYVFRNTDEGWKVFDVIIEGISYVSTYRSQIMPEVEANGLDAVIQRLASGDLVLQD